MHTEVSSNIYPFQSSECANLNFSFVTIQNDEENSGTTVVFEHLCILLLKFFCFLNFVLCQ